MDYSYVYYYEDKRRLGSSLGRLSPEGGIVILALLEPVKRGAFVGELHICTRTLRSPPSEWIAPLVPN